MALSLQGPDGAGGARVQVVVEADSARLQVDQTATGAKAALELTILAVARDRPTVLPSMTIASRDFSRKSLQL